MFDGVGPVSVHQLEAGDRRFSSHEHVWPTPIIERLNTEINARLADPKTQAQIVRTGYEPFSTSPAEFARLVAAETEKWGKVIRAVNIKVE
jgi:tripartite-type tricarboxylate transporter receptor subunit TctC